MTIENKYNFELDMESDNSNSAILRNIKPNSKVLEFGCAHGRMTKYLKEELQCNVTIVEIDEQAGMVAAQWSDKAYIGKVLGNIEGEFFFEDFKEKDFDYIIFADVLEHLRYPECVLDQSKNLLASNGSIWISIPNIGHNSVLLDLWNNKFTYRETGLLDNTHIRFFTSQSLENMILKHGFKITNKINLINTVENTEFHNSYDDVPVMVSFLLQRREFGEVYQFVWELKINE